MRWQNLPQSPNVINNPYPLSWIERDAMEEMRTGGGGLGIPGGGMGGWLTPDIDVAHMFDKHDTPEAQAWRAQNFPKNLPLGPLTDLTAAPDPSVLARTKTNDFGLGAYVRSFFPSWHMQPPDAQNVPYTGPTAGPQNGFGMGTAIQTLMQMQNSY